MLTRISTRFIIAFLLLVCHNSEIARAQLKEKSGQSQTGILEKMIVANGVVALDVDLVRLNGHAVTEKSKVDTSRFTIAPDSFFRILVFNNLLRGPEPGSMALIPQNAAAIPEALKASANQLVIEKAASGEPFDLALRDSKTGLVFFTIEGHQYDYDASRHLLNVNGARLLISQEFATHLGHASESGMIVGTISIALTLYPIEIRNIVNGTLRSARQPAIGTTPGPDVIVGAINAVLQATSPNFGVNGNYVGLGVGTTSCNAGTVDLDWLALPDNDHPVIPQNLYRMRGGTDNTERFEQIGQSWLKHAFYAASADDCSYGCDGVDGTHLGSGCSDVYEASLNYSQSGLGSRAWVNPFTGFYPGSNPNPADHSGHVETGTSHRVAVLMSDLNTALNAGATYFAEAQYVTPHEYAWCQSNPGQCNMYNNVSYRQFAVSGTNSPFTFSPVNSTMRMQPAINAWTGATINQLEPAPGTDGIAFIACKVTNPSAGVWHYEYALYNENLDRGIQSFCVPLGCGITARNLDFHAPPQEPGWANDGTDNNAGYSSTPWTQSKTVNGLTWSCETFAQNQNANAIRWGTLYNFRFDSNKPPQAANAAIGFFKTGSPIMVSIQAPTADPCNPLQLTNVVSRKTHGTAGTFDVDLPLSGPPGVECRKTGGAHTFVFTFTNNVVSGSASVTGGTGSVSGSPMFSDNTMTVNLIGVVDVQQIAVTASGVMDNFGQTLPDTVVVANILAGDTTANKTVNSSDLAQTKSQVGAVIDGGNFRNDVNASGSINASDVSQVRGDIGHTVP